MSDTSPETAAQALENDEAQSSSPEGQRAIARLVDGGKSFLWDSTFGSVARVLRSAILWALAFLAVGLIFQLFEVNTQAVSNLLKVAEFVLIVLLFPLAGLLCGAVWGLYRSLILQVETVEKAVQTAIDAVLAKVRGAAEFAGERVGQAIGVDSFKELLDRNIQELAPTPRRGDEPRRGRMRRRLSGWMQSKVLGTVRAVILRSFLREADDDTARGSKPDGPVKARPIPRDDSGNAGTSEPETSKGSENSEREPGRRVSLAKFIAFMETNALGLAFEQIKARIALLRLVPMIGAIIFIALPLLFAVIE